MANLTTDTETGKLLLQKNIEASGQIRTLLETENKFVDSDIIVEINTPAGALGAGTGSVEASSDTGMLGTAQSTQPASGHYIKVEGAANVAVATEGYMETSANTDVSIPDVFYPVANATFTRDGASIVAQTEGYIAAGETAGTIGAASQTITGGALSKTASSTTITSDGLSNGSSLDATSKVALTEVDAAGYYKVTTGGSATIARAAVTKQVTTAGYMTGDSNPVTAIESDSETFATANKSYYIKQSTLSASSVNSSPTAQTVTIGPGYYHEQRTVTINAMPTVNPTTNFADEGLSTYFNNGTEQTHNVSITPRYSNTAGYVTAHTNANNGGVKYYNIKQQTVTETTTSVNGTTATRGTRTESAGWKDSSETLATATFSNVVATGKNANSYSDISNTSAAPILATGDYLYINKGWTDDIKISLAELVPDSLSGATFATAGYILQGYGAWDAAGAQITGSIPTYAGAYTDL